MYTKILIAGATSYIASQCIPDLDFGNAEIHLISRNSLDLSHLFGGNIVRTLKIEEFKSDGVLEKIEEFLKLNSDDNLLLLNFTGSFGTIASLDTLNLATFVSEVNENLIPFMRLSQLIAVCRKGLFLSFAGAGIGGDNLETASPSYLASKASLAFLVEGFDNEFKERGIRFAAISPGAFPSKMQRVVAESEDRSAVTERRREQAQKTLESKVDPSKLVKILKFLIINPDIAGGRLWSATFDKPAESLTKSNFGKLRRVF
jgi:short-subunit dehydrogenase